MRRKTFGIMFIMLCFINAFTFNINLYATTTEIKDTKDLSISQLSKDTNSTELEVINLISDVEMISDAITPISEGNTVTLEVDNAYLEAFEYNDETISFIENVSVEISVDEYVEEKEASDHILDSISAYLFIPLHATTVKKTSPTTMTTRFNKDTCKKIKTGVIITSAIAAIVIVTLNAIVIAALVASGVGTAGVLVTRISISIVGILVGAAIKMGGATLTSYGCQITVNSKTRTVTGTNGSQNYVWRY